MGRIAQAFSRARSENRAALVIYLCAGDPDLATTRRLVRAIDQAGADIIELGVPFSDPTADGPVIQRASDRALSKGATLKGALQVVAELRNEMNAAIILFGYYNPILSYGEAKLAEDAARAGVDGFLVVDLPPEEAGDFAARLRERDIDFVPLVAPTTSDARLQAVKSVAGSFIYYVSLTGVTGAAAQDLAAVAERAAEVRTRTGLPVAVGFGLKTPEDVRKVAGRTDGAVVGSAVCAAIEKASSPEQAVRSVSALVTSLRAATGR